MKGSRQPGPPASVKLHSISQCWMLRQSVSSRPMWARSSSVQSFRATEPVLSCRPNLDSDSSELQTVAATPPDESWGARLRSHAKPCGHSE